MNNKNVHRLTAPLYIAILFSGLAGRVAAQERNEIGLAIGGTVTPSQSFAASLNRPGDSLKFDSGFAFVADYYHAFVLNDAVGIYGGASIAVSPNDVFTNGGPTAVPRQYAYLFLTPEIRVKFKPKQVIAPWLSFGGGWANFLEGALRDGSRNPNSGSNGGTLQFGGGIDVKTPFSIPLLRIPIGARVEVRDYYSSRPNYRVPVAGSLQNNVVFAAGIVLRR